MGFRKLKIAISLGFGDSIQDLILCLSVLTFRPLDSNPQNDKGIFVLFFQFEIRSVWWTLRLWFKLKPFIYSYSRKKPWWLNGRKCWPFQVHVLSTNVQWRVIHISSSNTQFYSVSSVLRETPGNSAVLCFSDFCLYSLLQMKRGTNRTNAYILLFSSKTSQNEQFRPPVVITT